MKIGFYAGSFDPFTNGHLHVIEKSAKLFDKVIVGIGANPKKARRFDREVMKKVMEQVIKRKGLDNVTIISYDNLSVDVAAKYNATFLVRGIRNGMDYEYEEIMASTNEEIAGIDTIYIRAGSLGNVSSSMVMELMSYNKDVSKYLPTEVLEAIKK